MYAMDFTQVGRNIQRQLDIKGVTQQSLADTLEIPEWEMNKLIKGSKAINVNELAKIAEVLGTSTDDLLMAHGEFVSAENLNFIVGISDEKTLEKVNLMRTAIDEINMLEELRKE